MLDADAHDAERAVFELRPYLSSLVSHIQHSFIVETKISSQSTLKVLSVDHCYFQSAYR